MNRFFILLNGIWFFLCTFAFGVSSLAVILFFFAIDSDAFVFDEAEDPLRKRSQAKRQGCNSAASD